MELRTGYMSPKGTLYECSTYGHMTLATRLVNRFFKNTADKLFPDGWDCIDAEFILLYKGWLQIRSRDVYHNVKGLVTTSRCAYPRKRVKRIRMSKEQRDFLEQNKSNAFNTDQFFSIDDMLGFDEETGEMLKNGYLDNCCPKCRILHDGECVLQ